ncbi:MAG: 1-deoxy-D-xylulose-5-phosphate reductoisomerase [Thermomicrobiales bacterium]
MAASASTAQPIRLALLGSTGSIGTQTLEVVDHHPGRFEIVALAAGKRHDVLADQVRRYRPAIVVAENAPAIAGKPALPSPEGLMEAATHPDVDIVVVATSGHAAIPAVMAAIEAGKTIAIANKETLVCAGELIMPLARKHGVEIRTVDSEHSAIWQSLGGRPAKEADRLLLTASGGPFRTTPIAELADATVAQALAHPNFAMGGKLTIDSATMMNKGLEVIEARWLFDVPFEKIEIVIHPQQIIHSMAEFPDGSVIAQLGTPDMRLPIQYALTYPDHLRSPGTRLDFTALPALTFESPDLEKFPSLRIAREAGVAGETLPTVLSAADEVAVEAFMHGKLTFLGIPRLVETVLSHHEPRPIRNLETVLEADRWARETARALLTAHA